MVGLVSKDVYSLIFQQYQMDIYGIHRDTEILIVTKEHIDNSPTPKVGRASQKWNRGNRMHTPQMIGMCCGRAHTVLSWQPFS